MLPSRAIDNLALFSLALVSSPVVAYLRHFPVSRGKWRLLNATSRFLVTDIGDDVWARVHGPELQGLIYGIKEQKETAAFLSLVRSGMTVLDIGANIGLYSLLSAKRLDGSGVVHAFEPTPFVAKRLRDNVRLNHFQNVIVNQIALSDQAGTAKFYVHEEADCNSLGVVSSNSIEVQTMSLDEYVGSAAIQRVDLIKIDVEGAEVKVLRGAHVLLSRADAPVMMLEFNPPLLAAMGTNDDELAALLSSYGYKLQLIAQHEGYRNVIATK
jgi:FkbM family methyltransferase